MSKVISLGGPIEEEEESGQIQVQVQGLNASVMKPKAPPQKYSSMGTGNTHAEDSDDDPMGRIPQPG